VSSSHDPVAFVEAFALRRRCVQDDARLIREQADTAAGAPRLLAETRAVLQRTLDELAAVEQELRALSEALFAAHVEVDEAGAWFQRLFELAPVAYLVTDLAGQIEQANQAACELFARTVNALVGRRLISFVDFPERPAFRAALRRAVCGAGIEEWPLSVRPLADRAREVAVTTRVLRTTGTHGEMLCWMLRDEIGRGVDDLL
jgi:PAS domain S-box-containing protein